MVQEQNSLPEDQDNKPQDSANATPQPQAEPTSAEQISANEAPNMAETIRRLLAEDETESKQAEMPNAKSIGSSENQTAQIEGVSPIDETAFNSHISVENIASGELIEETESNSEDGEIVAAIDQTDAIEETSTEEHPSMQTEHKAVSEVIEATVEATTETAVLSDSEVEIKEAQIEPETGPAAHDTQAELAAVEAIHNTLEPVAQAELTNNSVESNKEDAKPAADDRVLAKVDEPELTAEAILAMTDEELVAYAERLIESENATVYARQINQLHRVLSDRLKPARKATETEAESNATPPDEIGQDVVENEEAGVIEATVGKEENAPADATETVAETEVETEAEAETPTDPTTLRLRELFDKYFDRRDRLKAEQEKQRVENFKKKEAILNRLKEMAQNDETTSIYDEFKALQAQWRDIGHVPADKQKDLWSQYHFYIDKFYDNLKINRELKELDLKKNLEAKLELCERAESLILEDSINKTVESLNELHEKWKEIGPVPRDKKDEIWDRFKDASDKVYDRRKEYYDRLNEEQGGNLILKEAVLAKAEEVVAELPTTLKVWQEKSNRLTELQAEWKSIGFAPRKQNEELWTRFKTLCDTFFKARAEHYKIHRQDQINNQHLKTDLCVQAEALKDSKDWKKTADELMRLQEEWKKIGPAPVKIADKLWRRFRGACDEFFRARAENAKQRDAGQEDNLRMKRELLAKVEAYELSDDREQNFEDLKAFQREWMEIGFVPIKERDKLQSQFRAVINNLFDTLKSSRPSGGGNTGGAGSMYSTNRSAGGQGFGGGGGRRDGGDRGGRGGDRGGRRDGGAPRADQPKMSPEELAVTTKMAKIQADIDLWENNIEFFANSKNAEALRKEVENKINKAKTEVKELKRELQQIRNPKVEEVAQVEESTTSENQQTEEATN